MGKKTSDINPSEEDTPKLFSDGIAISETKDFSQENEEKIRSEQLFNQDTSEDEDFEIPAFLRRQKF